MCFLFICGLFNNDACSLDYKSVLLIGGCDLRKIHVPQE
jgi:hypothetical protein